MIDITVRPTDFAAGSVGAAMPANVRFRIDIQGNKSVSKIEKELEHNVRLGGVEFATAPSQRQNRKVPSMFRIAPSWRPVHTA